MSDLEDRISQVLSDPNLMQQIMAMASAMGTQSPPEPAQSPQESPSLPAIDLGMLRHLAAGTGVDANQKALLQALGPYISRDRTAKLEKAMRAAKIASMATALLGRR